jgi:uncharacterized membrane protein YiaA
MTTFEPIPTLSPLVFSMTSAFFKLGLERADPALQERLLLLGILVLGVLGDVAIQLRVMDARGRHAGARR